MKPFTYWTDADEPLSHAVVATVASVSDCRATKSHETDSTDVLPPLYEVVDPDALDALFRHPDDPDADRRGQIAFSYHGFRVTARSDGSVTVAPE